MKRKVAYGIVKALEATEFSGTTHISDYQVERKVENGAAWVTFTPTNPLLDSFQYTPDGQWKKKKNHYWEDTKKRRAEGYIKRLQNGETTRAIAKDEGVSYQTICNRVKKSGTSVSEIKGFSRSRSVPPTELKICAAEGCDRLLSQANKSGYCVYHQEHKPSRRKRKPSYLRRKMRYAHIQKTESREFWLGGYTPETAEFDPSIEAAQTIRGKKDDVEKLCRDLIAKLGEDLEVNWQETPNLPGSQSMQALLV